MNWNGQAKSKALGRLQACQEQIAVIKQRGYSSDEAGWLLKKVDPKENQAALIGLIVPIAQWAESLENDTREKWLMWALRNRSDIVREWLGYKEGWSMIPAVCKGNKNLVRLANNNGIPSLYLMPCRPRDIPDDAGAIYFDGHQYTGFETTAATYVNHKTWWYKAHKAKVPSKSAISRALRMYVLGVLVGRDVVSANDLMVYEVMGIKSWASYGSNTNGRGMVDDAALALSHLVTEPELAEELPS